MIKIKVGMINLTKNFYCINLKLSLIQIVVIKRVGLSNYNL